MLTMAREGVATLLLVLACASIAYGVLALLTVALFRLGRPPEPGGTFAPPVTLLKPVCGFEPGLFERLQSFCQQEYPAYQVVFGVRYAEDPAARIVERLIQESPQRDFTLVVDDRLYGSNHKMSNVANMLAAAKHDILIVADSDGLVQPTYLRSVVAPFEDRRVGAVTCLYVGKPIDESIACALGADFINDWFLPSVLVALALGKLRFCFGATMALRRDALEAMGGFVGLAQYLADDYLLGRGVSEQGLDVRLAAARVETVVFEKNLKALFRHELRWVRTFRTVRPVGWALTFVTDMTVLSLFFLLASGASALGWSLFGAAIVLRLALREAVRRRFGIEGPDRLWLVPVRDLLSFALRIVGFLGRGVEWRGGRFVVVPSGRLETRRDLPQ
jgi:ceramide glucosyltransferase